MLLALVRRALTTIPTLLVVVLFVFLLLRLTPGDPAAVLAGPSATNADIEEIRARLGLDQPILHQLGTTLWQLLHGDLGRSILSNVPVAALIADRAGPTIALALTTMAFTTLIAVPLGLLAGWLQGGWVDRALQAGFVLCFALPTFIVAYGLIWLIALRWDLLPTQGYAPLSAGIGAYAAHIALPTLTLSTLYIALIARVTRAIAIDVLHLDHVRTARAKGAGEARVLLRHVLRNSAVPIVTVIGIGFAVLVSGVVVTETVFNVPGLGRLTIEAVQARDFPAIQGLILFFSAIMVGINLLVDAATALVDPRVRAG